MLYKQMQTATTKSTALRNLYYGWHSAKKDISVYKEDALFTATCGADTQHYTFKELMDDREFVLYAIKITPCIMSCFCDISDRLKNDREVRLHSIRQSALLILGANDILRNDEELVIQAVIKHGLMLRVASAKLIDDIDIVLIAILENRESLRHASFRLKSNMKLVLFVAILPVHRYDTGFSKRFIAPRGMMLTYYSAKDNTVWMRLT